MLNANLLRNWVLNLSYSKSVQCKKGVTRIVMFDAKFSDHTIVIIWTFMNSVWHRMWVVWHTNKWSYICSIILLKYWKGFLGIPKSSLFLPCATMCIILHSNVLYCSPLPNARGTQKYNIKNFCLCNDMHYKISCNVQHMCKKLNFHNGAKSTVTLSNTRPCCVMVFLRCLNTRG